MRLRHWVTASLAGALVLSLAPAAAATGGGPSATVVVALRTGDPAVLAALTQAHGLDARGRAGGLATILPNREDQLTVRRFAASNGLRISGSSDWTVRVTGAVSAVASAFSNPSHPAVPAALSGVALSVFPGRGRVAHVRSSAPPPGAKTGNDLRTAYSAPSNTTLGQGLAIATVQLSGWKSADLTTYGQAQHPPLTPNYVAVTVAGGSATTPDGHDGDHEVALDQETLLSVAPNAGQRAYFAPNDDGGDGYIRAIDAVANDAKTYGIAALSLSWGNCENLVDAGWMSAMNQAIEVAVTQGVTVFAASGDEGSFDCAGATRTSLATTPTVDFPASSPWVVAVGGTNLVNAAQPSNVASWPGSGGGESTIFALPPWQRGVRAVSAHGRRLIPDIASDADPLTGAAVYDSVPTDPTRWWSLVGGTSLAAPTQAALLVDSLASAGWSSGIGDVHDALYTAPSNAFIDVTANESPDGNGTYLARTGYDVVTGRGTPVWSALLSSLGEFALALPAATNMTTVSLAVDVPFGLPADYRSWSPPVIGTAASCAAATSSSPPTSVDLGAASPDGSYLVSVSGIDGSNANGNTGTCHIAAMRVALDRVAPTVSASLRVSSPTRAIASWSFADAPPSSGVQKYAVTIADAGGVAYSATTTSTAVSFDASRYRSYTLSVVAYDNAGNASVRAVATLLDDGDLVYSHGWSALAVSSAYRHGVHSSATTWAGAVLSGTGRVFTAYVVTCPTCGAIAVYDGTARTPLRVVRLVTNRVHYLVPVTLLSSTTLARHVLTIRVTRGSHVELDAATLR